MRPAFFFVLLFVFGSAYPLILRAQAYQRQVELRSDDDSYLFYGQDKYYTAGTFLSYSYLAKESANRKIIHLLEFGQLIFTPYAGNVNDPGRQDRPFAGYAYIQGSRSYINEAGRMLKLSAALGQLGPQSGAEQVQEFVHRLLNLYKPAGWQYQIQNETGLQFQADYSMPITKDKSGTLDINMVNHGSLSNIFSNAATGLLLRVGRFNDPMHSVAMGGGNLSKQEKIQNEFFFYSKAMANYVFYDATIEGGFFNKKSQIVFDRMPFVFSGEFGCQYSHRRWALSYSVIFKSKEVRSIARADQYASIHISYRIK
ncbi:MAG: lipid A deacylase LpxR family protein [Bacteroidetes bacterium]|nr:lipid A deacylase LpxR family protein [Bacteroidota bacterium]